MSDHYRLFKADVSAMQWDGTPEGRDHLLAWLSKSCVFMAELQLPRTRLERPLLRIETANEILYVRDGDWLVKNREAAWAQFTVMPAEMFESMYCSIPDETADAPEIDLRLVPNADLLAEIERRMTVVATISHTTDDVRVGR